MPAEITGSWSRTGCHGSAKVNSDRIGVLQARQRTFFMKGLVVRPIMSVPTPSAVFCLVMVGGQPSENKRARTRLRPVIVRTRPRRPNGNAPNGHAFRIRVYRGAGP